MLPQVCNRDVLTPALALLPSNMDSDRARVLLLAIGLTESDLIYRHQVHGPARGLWQFELTGVEGVMDHQASAGQATHLCSERSVPPTPSSVYDGLQFDDILAAGIARLLLWTDPAPLPMLGDCAAARLYYLRNWRPGKPVSVDGWQANYSKALGVFN